MLTMQTPNLFQEFVLTRKNAGYTNADHTNADSKNAEFISGSNKSDTPSLQTEAKELSGI